MLLGNGLMVAVLLVSLQQLPGLAEMGVVTRIGAMLFICGAGAMVYGLGLLMAGMRLADLRQVR